MSRHLFFPTSTELSLHLDRYSLVIYPFSCRLDLVLHNAYPAAGTLTKNFHTAASVRWGDHRMDWNLLLLLLLLLWTHAIYWCQRTCTPLLGFLIGFWNREVNHASMRPQPARFGLTVGIIARASCRQFLKAEIYKEKPQTAYFLMLFPFLHSCSI